MATFRGTAQKDSYTGTTAGDYIYGYAGDDVLRGGDLPKLEEKYLEEVGSGRGRKAVSRAAGGAPAVPREAAQG